MAQDDPEGWEIYNVILEEARLDPDIRVLTNLNGVGAHEVNAFQQVADVAIQKSIREGFGLVVSEAVWKETPMVAGNTGGIPLQIQNGVGGFLVDSIEECAERTLFLLSHPDEAREIARRGKERVRESFLTPRLLRDELRLVEALVNRPKESPR
jgi:trehalose synthase